MFEYCENASFFISQTTNFFSNLAFVCSGALLFVQTRRLDFLCACLLISFSSSLWHFTEHPDALIFDKAIVGAVCLYLSWRLFQVWIPSISLSLAGVFLFGLLSVLIGRFVQIDNLLTSLFFLPIAALIFLSFIDQQKRLYLRAAALCLVLACVFRTLDLPLCDLNPVGTHSLWHIFTALTLYFIALRINHRAG